MDRNRELHELLGKGKTWHELVDCYGLCSCGDHHSRKLWPWDLNPDYAADPRLVLEAMRERDDRDEFAVLSFSHCDENDEAHFAIPDNLMLDRTGKLRDAAIEFLRREK